MFWIFYPSFFVILNDLFYCSYIEQDGFCTSIGGPLIVWKMGPMKFQNHNMLINIQLQCRYEFWLMY